MPIVHIIANSEATREAQETLLDSVTKILAELIKVPTAHVHVVISDGRLLSFGGDAKSPAVYITVKSAAGQIPPILRQGFVLRLLPVLQASYAGLQEARVTTFFEEVPVEQIAVGTSVMLFKPRESNSTGPSPRVSEDQLRLSSP